MNGYRAYVIANERWFRGRSAESVENLQQAETTLGITFPEDLKWVLSNYGYWHATGVCSLTETIEKTLLARQHVQLPHNWIVLYDHGDGGVFILDTTPDPTTGEHAVASVAWENIPHEIYSGEVFPSLLEYAVHLIEVEGAFLHEDDIDYDPSRYRDSS
jgi:cell wall assembly regulator SMI1